VFRKSVIPLGVTAGLLGMLLVPASGFALTTQQIDQELNQLKQSKAAAQQKENERKNNLNKVQQEKQQVAKDMDTILNQIDATNLKLNELQGKIETVSGQLKENGKQLEEAEARVTARDQMLRSRVRLMYMNGVVSYADVLLSSTSFTDFLDRLQALKSIVNQDKEILDANKKDRDLIVVKKAEIEKQLTEVKSLYAENATIKADLVVKEKEKEVKVASLSKKEQELEDIGEENEKLIQGIIRKEISLAADRRAQLERERAAAAAKNGGKAAAPAASAFTYSGGKMGFPLDRVVAMSSDYGGRADPFTKKIASHNGIDFPAPAGTPILAAEAGEVILASWVSGYGNTVIIDHGKGIVTLYAHIRNDGIVVEKGDTVKRGQKIAEVGSTGRSTGNHLHFEVHVNNDHVDPKPYLR
jgi:murein DD-endopeptidase MepM/ murein hydrolase activator NlpD